MVRYAAGLTFHTSYSHGEQADLHQLSSASEGRGLRGRSQDLNLPLNDIVVSFESNSSSGVLLCFYQINAQF